MDYQTKTPEEKLSMISPEALRDTPIELIRNAMLQHFEEDREFQKEIKDFMTDLRPYMQGAAGLGILWKVLIALGGLIVMWAQVKSLFGR